MATVTATELARHTRALLDQVASRGETLTIERNRVAIARIVPVEPSVTAGQAFGGLERMLTSQEGHDWLDDSKGDFDHAVLNPWE